MSLDDDIQEDAKTYRDNERMAIKTNPDWRTFYCVGKITDFQFSIIADQVTLTLEVTFSSGSTFLCHLSEKNHKKGLRFIETMLRAVGLFALNEQYGVVDKYIRVVYFQGADSDSFVPRGFTTADAILNQHIMFEDYKNNPLTIEQKQINKPMEVIFW